MNRFAEMEKSRKNCKTFNIIGIVLIILGFIIFLVNMGGEGNFESILGISFALMIIGIISAIISGAQFKRLSNKFKETYLSELVAKTFTNGKYFIKGGIDLKRLYNTRLVKKADRSSTEDLITGEIEGVYFQTCDVKLEERHTRHTKNGTQTYYVTYFLGRFFEFEFPKEFKGQVVVTEAGLSTLFSNLKKVELESVEFNKKFKTYAANEIDVFYIITPHFMESLMKLEKENPGTVMASFANKKLSIAINNSINTFELNLYKPIDEGSLKKMEYELNVIKDIVLELKLNNNIFIGEGE